MTADIPLSRQAQKALNTRNKIIAATIALIRQHGLAGATSENIARESGISWGAAQYHFGSKDEILEHVIGASHQAYLSRMEQNCPAAGALTQRIAQFVDEVWLHYQNDVYLAALEIVLASRDDKGGHLTRSMPMLLKDHMRVVLRIFHDVGQSESVLREAFEFAHCALTGLSLEKMFGVPEARLNRHLERVKSVMQQMLDSRGTIK